MARYRFDNLPKEHFGGLDDLVEQAESTLWIVTSVDDWDESYGARECAAHVVALAKIVMRLAEEVDDIKRREYEAKWN